MAISFAKAQTMTQAQLLADPDFKAHFVLLYNTANNSTDGDQFWERETTFLKKVMLENKKVAAATTLSLMLAMLDHAYHGLSIEPVAKAHAYYAPRATNVGTKDSPKWEQRVMFTIMAHGELALRLRSGMIRYADNPVMVYEGDLFEQVNGKIKHISRRQSETITGAWIKITRFDGSEDYKYFSMAEIQGYRERSDSKTSLAWTGGVNGQPTRGMIEAKVIKHAFSTYPKLKLGANTTLQTDDIEADAAYAAAMAALDSDNDPTADQPEAPPSSLSPEPEPVIAAPSRANTVQHDGKAPGSAPSTAGADADASTEAIPTYTF